MQPAPPKFTVLTVDHGLRAGSLAEARQVGTWARALGLSHHRLHWDETKPATGVQAAARGARYRLLGDWCLRHGAEAIVTAHTADDQAETLLMRLARGSGLDGLSAMPAESQTPWPVLRPLLGVTCEDLRAELRGRGVSWIDDPSNEDEQFERIRVRKAMTDLAGLGLTARSLALSARRLARANQAIASAAERLWRDAVAVDPAGYATIDLAVFSASPEEIRLRLLQRLVWQFGNHEMPRMAALERVHDWIASDAGKARTVGGCRIVKRKSVLVIGREAGRIASRDMELNMTGGACETVWDRRFRLRVEGAPQTAQLSVRPVAALDGFSPQKSELPAFVRDSLPAVMIDGELASIPLLGLSSGCFANQLKVHAEFIGAAA